MIEQMENNENSFVALWSDKAVLGCATLYANSVMNDDPFFNRLTDIKCKDFSSMLDEAEREFAGRGVQPFVHCATNGSLKAELERRGYTLHDTMPVLLHEGIYRLRHSGDISVEKVMRGNLRSWVDLFVAAFGAEDWRSEVERRLASSFDNLELHLAYVKGSPGGCAALFEKNSLLGLYCLGVLPAYRKTGMGTALLAVGAEAARARNAKLLLQTFQSEGLVSYYVKRGFTQVYRKEVYTLRPFASSAARQR